MLSSIAETARKLGLGREPRKKDSGRSAVYLLIERGQLAAVKHGARTMVTDESIARFVANLPRYEDAHRPSPRGAKSAA